MIAISDGNLSFSLSKLCSEAQHLFAGIISGNSAPWLEPSELHGNTPTLRKRLVRYGDALNDYIDSMGHPEGDS